MPSDEAGGQPEGWTPEEACLMTQSILVADDEPSILLSLQFLLQKAGYEVRLARTGEEVIQSVEQYTPDLLLLDAMMPERDGYDVCQTIRADPRWTGLPIIMLTAKSRDV